MTRTPTSRPRLRSGTPTTVWADHRRWQPLASSYLVNSAQYNANNQITQMTYGGINETRSYNAMFQLTSISSSGIWESFSEQYVFSPNKNNGQIPQMTEGTVTSQYG